jgi:hypothetical protein
MDVDLDDGMYIESPRDEMKREISKLISVIARDTWVLERRAECQRLQSLVDDAKKRVQIGTVRKHGEPQQPHICCVKVEDGSAVPNPPRA